MGSEETIKEKLEWLKKYVYDELNQLKMKVLVDETPNGKAVSTGIAAAESINKSDYIKKFKPTKHQMAYKFSGYRKRKYYYVH
ncbi:MAG: hypothetical protein N3B21_12755 [Clostridia bacterium]|nr:hypothetical protein [Clostridia bacterium]